ncbi:MAG: radical SAM family heme chaperone HemW [Pseudoflavonifractor sp.]
MTEKLGVYIHIPFCRSKCDYCDFYSLAGQEGRMDDYQKALLAHMKETAPFAKGYQVDTIYFGGGTPSFYGEKRIAQLLAAIRRHYNVTRDAEITMEANPDSVEKKMLTKLRRAGINRLSLGVQSACEEELRCLHRPHTFGQAQKAVTAARGAKLKNLSLDLIYGLPGQTAASWENTVEETLKLAPEHLSCYGLKVEEGTPLWQRVENGEQIPDDDAQADLYLWTVDRLAKAGYYQYEISNFAKSGFQSRHNLKYWMGKPYLGFGPGAHSDFGGRRYGFIRDLDGYINGVLNGGVIISQSDLIPKRERGGEYLMLRMRTMRGIEEWEYRREYYMNFEPIEQKLAEFERYGWATCQDRRWHFTPKGFLVSNQLIGQLLEVQENACLAEMMPKANAEYRPK